MSVSSGGLLEGIKVVEAAAMVMVPSVGAMLCDYGAEVVKIESLEGDFNRRGHLIPGMPKHPEEYEYTFLPDNRGKRSLALNLKDPAGHEILMKLLDGADVFLTNTRQKALDRLGLGYKEISARNPRLVYAHGTGFGDRGPEADKPGFDAVSYWSRSGMEASLFPEEGWLGSTGYGTGDHPSGMSLFSAVMLALFARERTGKGGRVSTSLLANGVWANAIIIQARLLHTQFQERRAREDARNFTGVYYRAGDGRIFKMAVPDIEPGWPKVCRAIGRPDLIDDPRYATLEARSQDGHMKELIELCDQIFATRPVEHWQMTLEREDVPHSLVANYDDVEADEQMAANDIFVEFDHPDLGKLRTVNSPFELDDHAKVRPRPAPGHGEHSAEVLAELGLDAGRIEELVERGVVKAGA